MSLRLSLYAFFLLCFSNSVSLSLSCFFSLLLYYLCRYQFSFFFLPTSLFLYDRFSLILLFLFIYFFLAFLLYKLFLVSPFRSFNVSLPYSKTDFSSFFMNFSINVRYFSIDSLWSSKNKHQNKAELCFPPWRIIYYRSIRFWFLLNEAGRVGVEELEWKSWSGRVGCWENMKMYTFLTAQNAKKEEKKKCFKETKRLTFFVITCTDKLYYLYKNNVFIFYSISIISQFIYNI